jgi:hypothetical protein
MVGEATHSRQQQMHLEHCKADRGQHETVAMSALQPMHKPHGCPVCTHKTQAGCMHTL